MKLHPLFAGFKGACPHAVGSALGFAVHVETVRGVAPEALPVHQRARLQKGGELQGFCFAGSWDAPGVHCLLFVKALTTMAASWFQTGCEHACRDPRAQGVHVHTISVSGLSYPSRCRVHHTAPVPYPNDPVGLV